MAIITGSDRTEKKSSMTANTISPAMHNQIQNIVASGEKKPTKSATTKRKEKNADTLNLVLPKGERSQLKIFCAGIGISMTEYAYTCMAYIRSEVEDGNMTVSRAGIRHVKKEG